MSVSIDIRYDGKQFPLEFENKQQLESTTVRELKELCEKVTGVHDLKLSAFGVLMKHEDGPLKQYHIRPGCFIVMKKLKKTQQQTEEESKLIQHLDDIQKKIETLTPQVRHYEKSVHAYHQLPEKTYKEKKKHIYMGAYLSEQLMHVLFDLDGILCGQRVHARELRKERVKEAQQLLDKVDEIKSIVKHIQVIDEPTE
ncbi:hypothetical protein BDB01DRAFT_838032 [Pilobolus umbonatus]|nr:hypothetical protein BDB01DRAFT_838032 [Pilobolus umbonatus]